MENPTIHNMPHNDYTIEGSEKGTLIGVPELPAHYLPRPQDITLLKLVILSYMSKVIITGNTWRVGTQSIGGIGKTVIASALVRDEEIRRTFVDGIIWVTLGKHPHITTKQIEIAHALGKNTCTYQDEQHGRKQLEQLLSGHSCLIVLDDAWEAEHIAAFDIQSERCRILITSRNNDLIQQTGSAEHRVQVLNDDQAVRLIALWSGIQIDKIPLEAHKVVRECGNIPLAIATQGALIRTNPVRWNNILYRLRNTDVEKIGKKFPDYPYPNLIKALHISVETLDRTMQKAYLSLAIFPEDTLIPESVILRFWQAHSALQLGPNESRDMIYSFLNRSLIQLDEQNNIKLHDLQSDYIRQISGNVRSLHHTLLNAYRPTNTAVESDSAGKETTPSPDDTSMEEPSTPWHILPPEETYMWQHLPYHLVNSGLEKELLCLLRSFCWIKAKLLATNINSLIRDYDQAQDLTIEPEEDEFALQLSSLDSLSLDFDPELPPPNAVQKQASPYPVIRDTLRLIAPIVAKDKQQLASQLIGRLYAIDIPDIQDFIGTIATYPSSKPWFRPLNPTLTPPGRHLIHTINCQNEVSVSVALSAYGRYAVTATDLMVKIWDIEYDQLIDSLEGHTDRVWSVALTPNGKLAISGSADSTIKVWDIEHRQLITTLTGHSASVWSVALTNDGRYAVSASDDHTIRIWDIENAKLVKTLLGHKDRVRAVAMSADGKRIVSASDDTTVKVWETDGGILLATLHGHTDWVRAVAINSDGSRAISGSVDRTIRVWDVNHRKVVSTLEGHHKEILSVAITGDGRKVVSASIDGTLKIWDIERQTLDHTLEHHKAGVNSVALSVDGQEAISSSYDGTIRLWNVGRIKIPSLREGHSTSISAIAITSDSSYAISASLDSTIKIWNIDKCTLQRTLHTQQGGVNSIVLLPDNRRILSISHSEKITLWDIQQGTILHTFDSKNGWILAMALSPDQQHLITVTDDEKIILWDIESGNTARTIETNMSDIDAIALLPDSTHALLATGNGHLIRYDLQNSVVMDSISGHQNPIQAIQITPDGSYACTASADTTIKVWNLETLSLVYTLEGHQATVNSIAITSDGKRLISASTDQTLRLWDITQGAMISCFNTDGSLFTCSIAPDDKTIVAGEESGRIHFLHLEEESR